MPPATMKTRSSPVSSPLSLLVDCGGGSVGSIGASDGASVETSVGMAVVGSAVVGASVGIVVGVEVGNSVRTPVGMEVVGSVVVGAAVGTSVGASVGIVVGVEVGNLGGAHGPHALDHLVGSALVSHWHVELYNLDCGHITRQLGSSEGVPSEGRGGRGRAVSGSVQRDGVTAGQRVAQTNRRTGRGRGTTRHQQINMNNNE